MVPVIGDRVSAALDAYDASITQLALEIGDSQQNLSLICRGVTRKTRRSRVVKIAEALSVPPEWLIGELDELPGAEMVGGLRVGAKPAAWQLSVSEWVRRTGQAHTRDLNAFGRREWSFDTYLRQGFALSLLINPGVWRELLLEDYNVVEASDDDLNSLSNTAQVGFTD